MILLASLAVLLILQSENKKEFVEFDAPPVILLTLITL